MRRSLDGRLRRSPTARIDALLDERSAGSVAAQAPRVQNR
jgi:hypothetical protein